MNIIRHWFERHFSDPEVVILAGLLVVGFAAIVLVGEMLAPAIAALVIAYLLDSPTEMLRRRGLPNLAATLIVFLLFVGFAIVAVFTVVPLLSRQVTQLVTLLPNMIASAQALLLTLPERYPGLVDESQMIELMADLRAEVLTLGQNIVTVSLEGITGVVTFIVYVILVPLMVFFFLKDKYAILRWLNEFLPSERRLADRVWQEVDQKTGRYVRGKVYEIFIVGGVSWLTFAMIDLQFAFLLGFLTGFSVLIPYIGAAVIFVPVTLVALFQWGVGTEFAIAVAAYLIIQALDGNLLAPLLFSEVVRLHPNAIIIAILIFGGLWGFWGLFFAIPLATLADAVLKAWPRKPPPDKSPPVPQAEQPEEKRRAAVGDR